MSATLILLRHGESTWNAENRFTGWEDVPLSIRGECEAAEAGRTIQEAGLQPMVLHTSLLRRAIQTADISLDLMGLRWIPVRRSWRLNERHYGALQGLNKAETSARHGEDQVKAWRRSYDVPPPPVSLDDPRHPANDSRYADLPVEALPATECLKDVVVRMTPWWYDSCVADLRAHGTVLVVAHGNSLRALVMHLDKVPEGEIIDLNIPTGIPLVYHIDGRGAALSREYLGDAQEIARRTAAVAAQASSR
jgi:2,3-bisphosphoglycerate-dependent phosphoglycerate mutase